MEIPKQDSFLDKKGQVASHIVSENQRLDVENTFHTSQQQARALDLIKQGKAGTAADALRLMQREDDSEPVNDAHQR